MSWPTHSYTFFANLEANNEKAWFDEHKAEYAEISNASQEFLDSVATESGGTAKIFRLRRDSRFSKGQPPYNTRLRGGVQELDGTVRWIEIDQSGLTVTSGHPMWDKAQLARAREALLNNTTVTSLASALDSATSAGLSLDEPELKKPLRDASDDHPFPDLTKHKHLATSLHFAAPKWLMGKGAQARIIDTWAKSTQLHAWLARHVGPPEGSI